MGEVLALPEAAQFAIDDNRLAPTNAVHADDVCPIECGTAIDLSLIHI